MAQVFIYKAKDRKGRMLSGSILADNPAAVAAHVRDQGYIALQIRAQNTRSLNARLQELKKVKLKELAVFARQFATMLTAGIPLTSCLNILIEQTENSRLKTALQDIYKRVQDGEPLSQALASYPRIFPSIMYNMIEAGEVGGMLDNVLERLAVHFEKEHKLNEKVKSAMTYPAVVMTLAILAVIFILTFVLPTFVKMFADMKIELPLLTRILLALSGAIRDYIFIWPLAILGFIYGLLRAYRTPATRLYIDALLLRLPIIGPLARKIAIARFSRTLGTLLHGGVPILLALEVVAKTMGNAAMIQSLNTAKDNVREGLGLAQTLQASNVFTPMVVQMVAVGEESGSLDSMLEKIADFYESEVDDMVGRLSSIIEPVIVAFLGIVIGVIIVAIMLPMFDIMSGIGVK